MDQTNNCKRFSGEIYIFGNDVERTVIYARDVINYAITGSLAQVASLGVQRVDTVDIQATEVNRNQGQSNSFPLTLPIMCGLIVSAVCIILGIVLLVLYMKKDKVRHHKLDEAQRTMMDSIVDSMSDSFRYFTADGRHVDETDAASFTSDISSVQIDFRTGRVSKMPQASDMIKVQFDPDYVSLCGLDSEGSCRSSSRASSCRQPSSETMSHPPHYLDDKGRISDS